jgi:hypothetical protein
MASYGEGGGGTSERRGRIIVAVIFDEPGKLWRMAGDWMGGGIGRSAV